jgi:hypothetical protein
LSIALVLALAGGVCAQAASIAIGMIQPTPGSLVGDDLRVVATITSTFELAAVDAQVEGREVRLEFSSSAYSGRLGPQPGWVGTLSLAGLDRGPKVLSVQAADFLGNASQALSLFIHDRKPVLTVTAPLVGTVARPFLNLALSSADDDPTGCVLSVSVGNEILATGQNQLARVTSLAAWEGKQPTLHFAAVDSAGQRSTVDVPVYVESSPRLSEAETVTGLIWDVQPDRILFLESGADRGVLKIRQRTTGQDVVIMDQPNQEPQYGYLTPKGAIFMEQNGDVLTALIFKEWDGMLVHLGFPNSAQSLVAKGKFAIWSSGQTLLLRDLVAGRNTAISSSAGNWKNDVAENGDVVYWGGPGYNIYRYRAGKTTAITSDGLSTYPLTDGANVVYRKANGALFLHDGSREIELSPGPRPEAEQSRDNQINNG